MSKVEFSPTLVARMGVLETHILDPEVTEILVCGPDQIMVTRTGKTRAVEVDFPDAKVRSLASRLLRSVGRTDTKSGVLTRSGNLGGDLEVHILGGPRDKRCPVIRVVRKAPPKSTLADLEASGILERHEREILERGCRQRRSIVVSGHAGSGRTTLLAALIRVWGAGRRIALIEPPGGMLDRAFLNQPGVQAIRLDPPEPEKAEVPLSAAVALGADVIVADNPALELWPALLKVGRPFLATVEASDAQAAVDRLFAFCLSGQSDLSEAAAKALVLSIVSNVVEVDRIDQRSTVRGVFLPVLDEGALKILPKTRPPEGSVELSDIQANELMSDSMLARAEEPRSSLRPNPADLLERPRSAQRATLNSESELFEQDEADETIDPVPDFDPAKSSPPVFLPRGTSSTEAVEAMDLPAELSEPSKPSEPSALLHDGALDLDAGRMTSQAVPMDPSALEPSAMDLDEYSQEPETKGTPEEALDDLEDGIDSTNVSDEVDAYDLNDRTSPESTDLETTGSDELNADEGLRSNGARSRRSKLRRTYGFSEDASGQAGQAGQGGLDLGDLDSDFDEPADFAALGDEVSSNLEVSLEMTPERSARSRPNTVGDDMTLHLEDEPGPTSALPVPHGSEHADPVGPAGPGLLGPSLLGPSPLGLSSSASGSPDPSSPDPADRVATVIGPPVEPDNKRRSRRPARSPIPPVETRPLTSKPSSPSKTAQIDRSELSAESLVLEEGLVIRGAKPPDSESTQYGQLNRAHIRAASGEDVSSLDLPTFDGSARTAAGPMASARVQSEVSEDDWDEDAPSELIAAPPSLEDVTSKGAFEEERTPVASILEQDQPERASERLASIADSELEAAMNQALGPEDETAVPPGPSRPTRSTRSTGPSGSTGSPGSPGPGRGGLGEGRRVRGRKGRSPRGNGGRKRIR